MPEQWLQVRGDPSVREFLFQQSRAESLFDNEIDRIHEIACALMIRKGAFHIKLHYSSNQLTCWFADDAYRYRIFVKEEVLKPGFLRQFRNSGLDHLQPLISDEETRSILAEFKRLRLSDSNIYARNGSINRINGMLGMTFSCDGQHYIDHKTFFNNLATFGMSDEFEPVSLCG